MKNGVKILGISTDPVDSHKKFCESLKLPFPLLSDPKGEVSRLFGVLLTPPGGVLLSGRSVFLVDRKGVLRHAEPKYELKPDTCHDALVRAMESVAKGPGKLETPKLEGLRFGHITVNGKETTEDIVIEGNLVRERDKRPSRAERAKGAHTPLTPREEIPWDCTVLVVGTGMSGSLPVTETFKAEAKKRNVELVILTTPEAVKYILEKYREGMHAVLHITC